MGFPFRGGNLAAGICELLCVESPKTPSANPGSERRSGRLMASPYLFFGFALPILAPHCQPQASIKFLAHRTVVARWLRLVRTPPLIGAGPPKRQFL
jgi:hypothetical protein